MYRGTSCHAGSTSFSVTNTGITGASSLAMDLETAPLSKNSNLEFQFFVSKVARFFVGGSEGLTGCWLSGGRGRSRSSS